MADASDPSIVVLAVPHLYATVVAEQLEAVGLGPVVVPNLDEGEWQPTRRYRAVIASVPTPKTWADITVELPLSFADPVLVSTGDVTVPVPVTGEHPLRDVATLLAARLQASELIVLDDDDRTTAPS